MWLLRFILPMSMAPCIAAMQKSAMRSALACLASFPFVFSFKKKAASCS